MYTGKRRTNLLFNQIKYDPEADAFDRTNPLKAKKKSTAVSPVRMGLKNEIVASGQTIDFGRKTRCPKKTISAATNLERSSAADLSIIRTKVPSVLLANRSQALGYELPRRFLGL